MKSFREMISWELEQERKNRSRLEVSAKEMAEKLNATVLRKMRSLSTASGDSDVNMGFGNCG